MDKTEEMERLIKALEQPAVKQQIRLTRTHDGILQKLVEETGENLSEILRRIIDTWVRGSIGTVRSGRPVRPDNEQRQRDMFKLRHENGMSLAEIGSRYGISRERVRQIIGNSGQVYHEKRRPERKAVAADPTLTNHEVAERLQVTVKSASLMRSGWHIVSGDSSSAVGNEWELKVANLLSSMGHETELQPLGSPFDLLVDGKLRIDVKSASPNYAAVDAGRAANPRYGFSIRKQEDREPVDFFVLITIGTEDIFVVPYDELPMPKESLIFHWPTARPTMGKYQQYLNRFDLLEVK